MTTSGPALLIISSSSSVHNALLRRVTSGKDIVDTELTPLCWKIQTKYYEVDVEIRLCLMNEHCTQQMEELEKMEFEAILGILNTEETNDFTRMQQWFENCLFPWKPQISLLALNHHSCSRDDGQGEKSCSWEEEAQDWALQHRFECVHISLKDEEMDASFADDDQGVNRLRAALESHMWPGHTLVQPSTVQNDLLAPPHEGDVEEDGFEKLMADMSSARDRLQKLPDEERREAAGKLALQLAQYFADDDHEDDTSDI